VAVEELDRILDGHDVIRPGAVDQVDHRRERRRLAGAGRAGHEHEPAGALGQLGEGIGHAELLERLQLGRDETEGGTEALALEVDVHAEAREARDRVREVELPVDLELLLLLGREDPVEEPLVLVGRELAELLEAHEMAVHAHGRLGPTRDVQVRRAARDHALEQVVDRKQASAVGRKCGFHGSNAGYRQPPLRTKGQLTIPRLGQDRRALPPDTRRGPLTRRALSQNAYAR
jgi:hypothetical protein